MDRWDLGQADPLQWICREWVQELGFDETTVNVEGGDDRVGTKNTKVDGFAIWGEWAPYSMVQTPIWSDSLYAWRRNLCPSPPPPSPGSPPFTCGRSLILYISLRSILILHLLVIPAYTWVHVPSATLFDILWAAVTQIALPKSHVHISGVRMLAVCI